MIRYPYGIKGCHKCLEQSNCSLEEKRRWKIPCPNFKRVPKTSVRRR